MSKQRVAIASEPHAATAQLYANEANSVRRFLRCKGAQPADADDVVQDVFLRAMLADAVEPPWLRGAAWRIAAGHRRRKSRQCEIPNTAVDEQYPAPVEDGVERVAVRRSLQRMNEGARGVLAMYEIGGMSLSEIAQTLETSKSAAAVAVTRARKRFVRHYAA